jgi:hypothetical protein
MCWAQLPRANRRVKLVCIAPVILALGVALSVTAFFKVCTGFRFWDDMGYVMLTQKTLADGHPLSGRNRTRLPAAFRAIG